MNSFAARVLIYCMYFLYAFSSLVGLLLFASLPCKFTTARAGDSSTCPSTNWVAADIGPAGPGSGVVLEAACLLSRSMADLVAMVD